MKAVWKMSDLSFIRNNLNMSDYELADHFGVSYMSVQMVRVRHGIKRCHKRGRKRKTELTN